MAFLGTQLVITMVMASFLQKLMPYISLPSFILCKRLVRYLHPTDEALKNACGKPAPSKGKKGKKETTSDANSGFNIPKNADIELEVAPVQPTDIIHLHFYPEFQWIVNYSSATFVVYLLTEAYYYWSSIAKQEINLSMLWSFLVIIFALKILCSLTALYFRDDATQGERSMTLVCGSSFFLVSMIVLIADERVLEFELIDAHSSLQQNAAAMLKNHGIDVTGGPASKLTFKFVLAVWSALIGAFFTFPGMRSAKMHIDSLNYTEGYYFIRSLMHVNMMSLVLVPLLWVKPISRDCLTTLKCSSSLKEPIMSNSAFECVRLYTVIAVLLLRMYLMPQYLQSYLNIAHDKIKQLKKEAGRINSLDLQRRVARIFYYLCVIALQYLTPILICIYLIFMLKTLGGYAWHPQFSVPLEQLNATNTTNQSNMTALFSPVLYRGVLNYATWWSCTTLSLTTGLGFIYHSYFASN